MCEGTLCCLVQDGAVPCPPHGFGWQGSVPEGVWAGKGLLDRQQCGEAQASLQPSCSPWCAHPESSTGPMPSSSRPLPWGRLRCGRGYFPVPLDCTDEYTRAWISLLPRTEACWQPGLSTPGSCGWSHPTLSLPWSARSKPGTGLQVPRYFLQCGIWTPPVW